MEIHWKRYSYGYVYENDEAEIVAHIRKRGQGQWWLSVTTFGQPLYDRFDHPTLKAAKAEAERIIELHVSDSKG